MFVSLTSYLYNPIREFSYDLNSDGFDNLSVSLLYNYDVIGLYPVVMAYAYCDQPNEYFLAGSTVCSVCTLPPLCLTCNSSTGCGKCQDGYFVDTGSVCTACLLANCL